MFAVLTATGLSAAAGLNAYVPFLIVALLARFTDVFALPHEFSWVASWPTIIVCALLLISEVVLDKIPAVDSVNDMVGTVVRPTVGGFIAAVAPSNTIDHSQFLQDHAWITALGGVLIAGVVHAGKAGVRPVANLSTGGLGAPVLSTAEDATSITLSIVAIFAPVLVIVVLIFLAWAIWRLWRRLRRLRARRRTATV